MSAVRKVLIFLLIFVILGMAVLGLFINFWTNTAAELLGTPGGVRYYDTSVASDRSICALGADARGHVVVEMNQYGKKLDKYRLTDKMFPERYSIESVFSVSSGQLLLSLYEYDENGNAAKLEILSITDRGKAAAVVMAVPCEGETLARQKASAALSEFSVYDGDLWFSVAENGVYTVYAFTPGENVVRPEGSFGYQGGAVSFAALSDGCAIIGKTDGGALVSAAPGGKERTLFEGRVIERIFASGRGYFYLDAMSGKLFSWDLETGEETELLDIPALPEDIPGLTPAKITAISAYDDTVALVSDGGSLAVYNTDDGQWQDFSSVLHPGRFGLVMAVVGTLLALLIITYAIWHGVCISRKMRLSMLIRKGVVLLFLLAVVINAGLLIFARPAYIASGEAQARSLLKTAAQLSGGDARTLSAILDEMAASDVRMKDCTYTIFSCEAHENEKTGAVSYDLAVSADGAGLGTGTGMALPWRSAFYYDGAAEASENGFAEITRTVGDREYFTRFQRLGDGSVMAISVNAADFNTLAMDSFHKLAVAAELLGLAILLITLLMLTGVVAGIRRIIRGVDLLNTGSLAVEIVQNTGDELQELADSFNDIADTMDSTVSGGKRRSDSYLRFVPQQIIDLLGESSVEDVSKQSFVSRRMATMMVGFTFPAAVYESRTRALFDNINEVVEKTSLVVSRNGGTIYNFTYSSYDAVFPEDPRQAVSTAVTICQEIIALNKERELKGQPRVTMQIAVDVDNVMLGIVGDETRMVPVAISTGFTTVQHLISLCGKLESSILCTEAVASAAEGYKSRYVGKSGDQRIYEIFEGDSYAAKADKEASSRSFSEGVYLFYSGAYGQAKSIFMDIAQQRRQDGAARYYLYLSDRYEKENPEEAGL